jgi:hypothetical protein
MKRWHWFVAYFLMVFLLVFLLCFILFPSIFRFQFIHFQAVDEILPSIYVSKAMTAKEKRTFLNAYDSACKRVESFWGSKTAIPIMVVGSEGEIMKKFGNEQHSKVGMTHFTPWGTYIVIDEEGVNVDVISHELAHAELFARIGWQKRTFEIPTWFDEGLAMLLDNRFAVEEEEWKFMNQHMDYVPDMKKLATAEAFFGNPALTFTHYMIAKNEVQTWLQHQDGDLLEFIDCLKENNGFVKCYQK